MPSPRANHQGCLESGNFRHFPSGKKLALDFGHLEVASWVTPPTTLLKEASSIFYWIASTIPIVSALNATCAVENTCSTPPLHFLKYSGHFGVWLFLEGPFWLLKYLHPASFLLGIKSPVWASTIKLQAFIAHPKITDVDFILSSYNFPKRPTGN